MSETGLASPAYRVPPVETRFKPGQSGNPAGRPKKDRDIIKQAKDSADDAMRTLVRLLKSSDERVALNAAQAIIDRAIGKPTQTNVNVSKTDVADLDLNELYAIAKSGGEGNHQAAGSESEPDQVHGVHAADIPDGGASCADSGEAGSH